MVHPLLRWDLTEVISGGRKEPRLVGWADRVSHPRLAMP